MPIVKVKCWDEEHSVSVPYVVKEYIEYLETCVDRCLWLSSWELYKRSLWLLLDGKSYVVTYPVLWYILDLKRQIHVRNN